MCIKCDTVLLQRALKWTRLAREDTKLSRRHKVLIHLNLENLEIFSKFKIHNFEYISNLTRLKIDQTYPNFIYFFVHFLYIFLCIFLGEKRDNKSFNIVIILISFSSSDDLNLNCIHLFFIFEIIKFYNHLNDLIF